jgi:hypothetical protein
LNSDCHRAVRHARRCACGPRDACRARVVVCVFVSPCPAVDCTSHDRNQGSHHITIAHWHCLFWEAEGHRGLSTGCLLP